MKRAITVCIILIISLLFVSFGVRAGSFNWAGIEKMYAGVDSAGVRHDGFVNTAETNVNSADDALRLAQNEHNLQADESYSVKYDEIAKMWQVYFYPKAENVCGGDIFVYLNDKGITQLIVAGE